MVKNPSVGDVESSQVSYQAVCVVLVPSTLSIKICVTDVMVALLYLSVPFPGSPSVIVLLKV
jgi:hypothetical protein